MKQSDIARLHHRFESLVQTDEESGTEFWLARDLQEVLGYTKWDNFLKVIDKAKESCQRSGYEVLDHFLDVGKMIGLGKGGQREIQDIALTRYAYYLIAQNGNPAKSEIAFAQTYFAVQTRRQEIIAQKLAESERLHARRKLTLSEKELSGQIADRLGDDGKTFAQIRSKGDAALFGGHSTRDMKARLSVPLKRALADFLPTITIKAMDFANEITNFSIRRDDLRTEPSIADEHVKNNEDVRTLLTDRDIHPERLPAAEDIKRVERRAESEIKRLPQKVEPLPHEGELESE